MDPCSALETITHMDELVAEKFKRLESQGEHNAQALERVAQELHNVSTDFKVLAERLGAFNSAYEGQVKGLGDLENRQTILEKSIANIHTDIAVMKKETEVKQQETKNRLDSNRNLTSVGLTILGMIIGIVTFLLSR